MHAFLRIDRGLVECSRLLQHRSFLKVQERVSIACGQKRNDDQHWNFVMGLKHAIIQNTCTAKHFGNDLGTRPNITWRMKFLAIVVALIHVRATAAYSKAHLDLT